ncbi:unnamed protein product [Closterium sp. NIES-54]
MAPEGKATADSPGLPPATPTAPSAVTSVSAAVIEQLVARINALESHQAISIDGSSYARRVAGLPLPGEDRHINSERSFTFDNRQASAPVQDCQHRTQSETIATMQTKFVMTSKLKTSVPSIGKDFYTWSFEFKLLTTTAQICLPFPTEGTIQEKNRYYHESLLAYTTLLRNLFPSEQLGIRSYKSEWAPAYASWENMCNSYMATDPVTMIRLLSQLTSVKMQQGEKAGPYINRYRNLRDHIKKCGGIVPDDMFVYMVLSGLSPSAPPLGLLTTTATTATATATTAAPATAAPENCATMASLRVLVFDHEGRPVAFDMWHDDLQLYLLSDIKDNVSLFGHWLSHDATARLAIPNHLPVAECTHFGQQRTAQALYDAVVARYSSSATTASPVLTTPGALSLVTTSSAPAGRICLGIAGAALGASASGTLPRTTPAEALHTFTLDSGASPCFVSDGTTLTPLPAPVPVKQADPSRGLVLARSSTVLPCLGVSSGSLSGLHLPSFSTNLVSTAALQDAMVTTTTPGGQRVSICTCTRTGRHLATFTRRPGSSLYTLATEPPQVATPAQRAAPHSTSFPLTTAPLQSLHMDVWEPSHVIGQGCERYFLLVVDDYSRYTTVFPLRSKGEVVDVLIPWIPTVHLQLREHFGTDLRVLRLHSDRGSEFSSYLLREFFVGRAFSSLMEVARTSMIHAAAPHFLWPFAGPAPSGVSQVHPLSGTAPVQVAVGSSAAPGAASGGAEPGGAGSEGAGSGGAEPGGFEPGGGESEGAESGGAEPWGADLSRGPAGASPRLSSHQLSGGAAVPARAGSTRGAAAIVPGGSRTSGARAAGTSGVGCAGAGDPTEAGGAGAEVGGLGAGGAGAAGAGVGGTGAGGAGPAGAGAVDPDTRGVGGTVLPRQYFVPLLQLFLGVLSSPGLQPPFLCPPPDQSQPLLHPASPLPAPSPYTEHSGGLTEHREPASSPVSPVRTARRTPCLHPPPVPSTHSMALRPSSVPPRVPLTALRESSLLEVPDPESDRTRADSPTVSHLLATAVTEPSFESAAASALSACPPSVGGECALGTDVLEDRQEDFECLAATVPCLASMLLALEGEPDAPDIPTPRSYAEAITGPYSSQWQAAMDAEMALWKSTSTCVDEVPPPWVNIVDGMWIFRVKRPPGSPPAFKARYVARGFSPQKGVDYFQTFSPTPKMTTLRVLLHVAAQRDYELHSVDFCTAFLQGSLHEEIWLRRPPGFTGRFLQWHDTLRTTLAALGFAPYTADLLLFLRTDISLPPFYVLVYVNDLLFATAHIEALTLVKLHLKKRHTCTDLGELRSYPGLQITRDRAQRTITLTQSHMVHQVLQRFGFQFSLPQPTPLSTSHSLSAPPSDESVDPSGPYPDLVGCLMYLMTCKRPNLAYPLSLLARYVAPGRHRKVHWDAAKRVLRYLCSTEGMGLVLGGRGAVVLTGHADASWVDYSAT